MKKYTCWHNRQSVEVEAATMLEAQCKAARRLGLRDTQRTFITVRANTCFPTQRIRAAA